MKYGKPLLRSALATCVLLAAGCQTLDSTFNSITQPVQSFTNQGLATSNEHIVGQLMAIEKTQIEQSKLAVTKAHHHAVKAYAMKLHKGHEMGLKKILKVSQETGIKPVVSMTSQNIQNESEQEIANLKTLNGSAFDKAYIAYQVQDHQAALNQIDADLKVSTNPKLTKLLKESRYWINRHLHAAKKLQKKLGN